MSSKLITKTVRISNMTCTSCENRIERELRSMRGIAGAKVRYSSSSAVITYDVNTVDFEKIVMAIHQLGYGVEGAMHGTTESDRVSEKTNFVNLAGVAILLFSLYMLIDRFGASGLFRVFPQAEEGMSYGILFLIGLLTSFHCVAMCGGINLSQCVCSQATDYHLDGKLSALSPGILYNTGRVISYTVLGGLVGAAGSVISFSGSAKGIVQLAAGVFMVIMGLNMLNLFPWLHRLNPRMPRFFANRIYEQKGSNGPLYVGLLNGLMPCGPLQAMQLYALSTGSSFKGALSMLLFSLGTVPLMFGLGALSSLLSKRFTGKMMSVSATLVVILGVIMFSNGMNLSGITVPLPSVSAGGSAANSNEAVIQNGVQTVTTTLSSGSYEPIILRKGVPVRWIIQAEKGNINGCNNEIVIAEFNKQKKLEPGDNIIEFTPDETGTFTYSCWMGMIRSTITVVDEL
ncbi:MAG: heavy metal transporter [Clostridiales bacterium]|nr:heavy metal transporter [Clostridiales bacterium]